MDYGRSAESLAPQGPISLIKLIRILLSVEEAEQIQRQFDHECRKDSQVLWTGIPREKAQAWADKRNLQTLTTVMGPLMDERHSSCLKPKKSARQWTIYVKGASALFACHILKSSKVTVLSPPPPEKLNPSGYTNYQLIEEPILKGVIGGRCVKSIHMIHPTVKGAEEFSYQSWPIDRTQEWAEKFPSPEIVRIPWRLVKILPEMQHIRAIVTIAGNDNFVDPRSHLPSQALDFATVTTLEAVCECSKPDGSHVQKVTCDIAATRLTEEIAMRKRKVDKEIMTTSKPKRKKENEEKERKAREDKAKRKMENMEKEKKAKEQKVKRERQKAQQKIENKEKEKKAREEKARRKMESKEKEKKAKEDKLKKEKIRAQRKKENEEKVKRAKEAKVKRKMENREKEKRAREEKLRRDNAKAQQKKENEDKQTRTTKDKAGKAGQKR